MQRRRRIWRLHWASGSSRSYLTQIHTHIHHSNSYCPGKRAVAWLSFSIGAHPEDPFGQTETQDILSDPISLSLKRLLQLQFDFDLTTMKSENVRFFHKNEHVHFYGMSRGVISNKKAVCGTYNNDVIVYVTVIRMAFTLTDQHRVASFDCRRWYSPLTNWHTSEVKCRLVW